MSNFGLSGSSGAIRPDKQFVGNFQNVYQAFWFEDRKVGLHGSTIVTFAQWGGNNSRFGVPSEAVEQLTDRCLIEAKIDDCAIHGLLIYAGQGFTDIATFKDRMACQTKRVERPRSIEIIFDYNQEPRHFLSLAKSGSGSPGEEKMIEDVKKEDVKIPESIESGEAFDSQSSIIHLNILDRGRR
jgi:hypothetical protein